MKDKSRTAFHFPTLLAGITTAIQLARNSQIARECEEGATLPRLEEDGLLALAAYAASHLGRAVEDVAP